MAASSLAPGQAWLPARGEGSLSLSYFGIVSSDHLLSSGARQDRGPMTMNTITAAVLYGITDRIAVSAEAPYVASKFNLSADLAPNAHDAHSTIDDGRYRGTLQDIRASVKFNVIRNPMMGTLFFEIVAPMTHYETFGHSAPGKRLRNYRVGGDLGRLLDPILPRAYFDLRYAYSFVEKLAGMNLDRHNADLEIGYFLKPSLSLRAIGSVQKTVGGVEAPVPPDSPYFPIHDRVERAHYSRIGGGVTLSLRPDVDVFFLVVSTLSGKNVQAFTAPAVGVSWNFRTRRPVVRPPSN